jgi:hypothetical protein
MVLSLLLPPPWTLLGNRLDFNVLQAEENKKKMENPDQLKVERVGGFGGFGLPGSHLKSKGEIALSTLPHDDVLAIDALFQGGAHLGAAKTDGFIYRITRQTGTAATTIEVPEEQVPASIRSTVKDTLE